MNEQKSTEVGLIVGFAIACLIAFTSMIAMIRKFINEYKNPMAFTEPNETKVVRDEVLSLIKEPETAIDS